MTECMCENCMPLPEGLTLHEECMCNILLERGWKYKYLRRYFEKRGQLALAWQMHDRMEECAIMAEDIKSGCLRGVVFQ